MRMGRGAVGLRKGAIGLDMVGNEMEIWAVAGALKPGSGGEKKGDLRAGGATI